MAKKAATKPSRKTARVNPDGSLPIGIVGGGITGLFCAYILASLDYRVEVFESSELFGGRIRSFLLHRDLMEACEGNEHLGVPEPIGKEAVIGNLRVIDGDYENLEFCAEFGPMRIELDVQVLLNFLLEHLGIVKKPDTDNKPQAAAGSHDDATKIALAAARPESFPSFSSQTSEADPLYQLRPDEEGKDPLELMSLALCRAVVNISIDEKEVVATSRREKTKDEEKYLGSKGFEGSKKKRSPGYKKKRELLIDKLRNAAAVQEPIGPVFAKWAKTLREDDYWVIARYGRVEIGDVDNPTYVPLYTVGFWNLMSIYLSHNALTKVRDLGTFYHLLPENPNAAHWLTWQLRQLSISGQLQGIYGGMQAITKKLLDRMHYTADEEPSKGGTCRVGNISIPMNLKAQVTSINKCASATNNGASVLKLALAQGQGDHPDPETEYGRVILALPKAPAQQLVAASPDLTNAHNERGAGEESGLARMLDSSFGFPMVKVFFVVRDRWWEEAKRTNWFATRFPTREVHYWKSRDPHSRRGMVMLYTDRPASSFWANYVPAGRQNDVEELCSPDGERDEPREVIRARLKQRLVQYITENQVPDITEEDIIWCGIMDWGRLPYGAANHAWRPERRFWETMADLAEITLEGAALGPHVHVCGEAFADYTGFIEGSLRSATYTLTKILQKQDEGASTAKVLARILDVLDVSPERLRALEPPRQISNTDNEPADTAAGQTLRERDYLEDLTSWVDSLNNC